MRSWGRVGLAWPYAIGLVVLVGVPSAAALAIAFTEFSGIRPPRFAGIYNFERMLGDDSFWRAFGNSAIYVAMAIPLRIVSATGFALLLHRRSPAAAAGRPVVYLPSVVPEAAYALLWLWLLNPLYGPLAAALGSVGVESSGLLTDPWATRIGIAVMSAFQIGEAFVIALAARRSISVRLYEAAAVDGARPWFSLTRITLPLMAPILALLALRDVVLSFQINFVPALLITDGGPRDATTYLSLLVYRNAFTYFRLGYASAIAVTMFVVTAAAVAAQYRLARRWRLV